MNKTSKSILILVTLIIILCLYLINSKIIINSFLDYSYLFITTLFPVSFIFFIISSLLIDYGIIELINKYLHLNTTKLYVLVLSLISGFPSGAKYTKELLEKDLINSLEANQIIMFSHFPNPLFVLGSINLILKDNTLCLKLLISIILSNIIIFFFNRKSSNKIITTYNYPISFSNSLSKAITNSFNIILLIYGTSIFFYLLTVIITKYLFINNYSYVLINGIFDLTKGVFSTTLINNIYLRAYFILFFISFGSISIHMQIRSIISNTSINYYYFIKGRIISTIISLILFTLMY